VSTLQALLPRVHGSAVYCLAYYFSTATAVAAAAAAVQMAERLVSGLPLRCDSVESQKVNEFLVKRLEVGLTNFNA
jgi:hypothetical protein